MGYKIVLGKKEFKAASFQELMSLLEDYKDQIKVLEEIKPNKVYELKEIDEITPEERNDIYQYALKRSEEIINGCDAIESKEESSPSDQDKQAQTTKDKQTPIVIKHNDHYYKIEAKQIIVKDTTELNIIDLDRIGGKEHSCRKATICKRCGTIVFNPNNCPVCSVRNKNQEQ